MIRIPRYIDDQPTILFWDMDEIVIIFLCVLVGLITGELTKIGLSGLVISKLISKLKQNKSEGYFLHVLYWWGLMPLKGLPPSYKRSLIE